MTLTEKILARRSGKKKVEPGEVIWVDVDTLLTHDVCGPGAFSILKSKMGQDARVWDPERVVIIPDHFIFTQDPEANRSVEVLREFAREQGIVNFYDVGTDRYKGVCHVAMAEQGHALPGDVIFGTDSHTCTAGAFGAFASGIGNTDAAFVMGTGKLWVRVPSTIRVVFDGEPSPHLMAKDMILALLGRIGVDGATYRALEFSGTAVESMEMAERMTLCNMAVEAGAKSGIIGPDRTTLDFVRQRTKSEFKELAGDPGAPVENTYRFDTRTMEPQVAKPSSPKNAVPVGEVVGERVDRCYIGSCTGGKTWDFVKAARILKGKRVAVDTYCVPATVSVEKDLETTLIEGESVRDILESSGARVGPPSCAACLGGPPDTFGRLNGDEVCISTTNRNFPGRMGSAQSSVYLASPYTVAASAVKGCIADPREFL